MRFDTEYKLQEFREEQPELFDAKGKRYTGTELSNRTAEMMLEIINLLEEEINKPETKEKCTACSGGGYYCGKSCGACDGKGFNLV